MKRIQKRKLKLETLTVRALANVRGGNAGANDDLLANGIDLSRQCPTAPLD